MLYKKLLRYFVLCIINLVEKFEHNFHNFDEVSDINKILEFLKLSDVKTKGEVGEVVAEEINKTVPFNEWVVEFKSGNSLYGADLHKVITKDNKIAFLEDLSAGDELMSECGVEVVKRVYKCRLKISMFDLSISKGFGTYYTDGVLSHNTVTAGIFISWYLTFHFDRNVIILANKLATSEEILSKIKDVLKNLPFFIKLGVVTNNVKSMAFDNGCRVICGSTTKSSAIGYTIHLAFIDEFAHIAKNDLDDFYRSVYPTISSSKISRFIITSTPNGLNKFHEIYVKALNGENSYFPIRVDWWEVEGRDEEWVKRQIADLGEDDFNQEFGNQFLAGSKLLLEHQSLKFMEKTTKEYVWREIEELNQMGTDTEPFNYTKLKWHPNYDINKIKEDSFVISIDLSQGKSQDYHVVNIFKIVPMTKEQIEKVAYYNTEADFFNLLQVGLFRCNKASIKSVSELVYGLSIDFMDSEKVKIVLEENMGSGEMLARLEGIKGGRNKFGYHTIVHYKHSEKSDIQRPGLRINAKNKIMYCRAASDYIKAKRIIITEPMTFHELSCFGLNKAGNSFESQLGHDDVAMSVVLASSIFQTEDWELLIEDIFDKCPSGFKSAVSEKEVDSGFDDTYISMISELYS
jgi:hypothetical protein